MLLFLQNKKKLYALAMFFMVAIGVVVAGLVYPIMNGIKQSAAEVIITKDEILHADVQSELLSDFAFHYPYYEYDLLAINDSFVDLANPIDFIGFLEAIASSAFLDIDITLSDTMQKNNAKKPTPVFSIIVKGDFNNILAFVQKVERGPYLASIKKMTMQTEQDEAKNTIVIQANIVLEVATR
jgi:hypothetical protein